MSTVVKTLTYQVKLKRTLCNVKLDLAIGEVVDFPDPLVAREV